MAGAINSWDANKPAATDYIDASDDMIRDNWAEVEIMVGSQTINLVVQQASDTTVTITADRIALFNGVAPPLCYVARSLSLTADVTASGVNGLDAGAEANSTRYYVWAVYNSATDTVASLLSTSPTSPTMPSGYALKRLVGAVYNDSAGNFVAFVQRGTGVVYKASQQILTGARSDAAWVSAVTLAAYVPATITRRIFGYAEMTHNQGTGNYSVTLEFAADASGNYPGTKLLGLLLASGGAVYTGGHFQQELTAQSFSYRTTDGAPAVISVNAYLQGYCIEV